MSLYALFTIPGALFMMNHRNQKLTRFLAVIASCALGLLLATRAGAATKTNPSESTNSSTEAADAQWARFRGADGNGISAATNLPVRWSDADVRWKVSLPGVGHSSPVVWKDRLFLSSGNKTNADRYVVCVQASDGKTLWEKTYSSQTFPQNSDNSFGSSTPAVDDSGVYVYWTTPDAITVVALGLDGREKWSKNLGPFNSRHGSGVSPVVVNHLVWINNDQDGPSSLIALDAMSGEIKYKLARTADKTAYGTPCLFRREGRPDELIFASSSHGLTSLNPSDGSINWECPGLFTARVVSSPITGEGLVICSSGEGGVGKRLVAVRPPAGNNKATVVYDLKTGIPNVPTPLAKDGRLYLLCDNGLIQCVRTATGESLWQQKLPERFYGSPVWAEGRLYFVSKSGVVFVIAAGDRYELLAQNTLGEASFATPAVANGTLYFRTVSHLIAVGGKR
jgi:outer membrane protein assembly factor BamB